MSILTEHETPTPEIEYALLTGFEPFGSFAKINPSWEAVKPLASKVLSLQGDACQRLVHLDVREVPVVYDKVRALIPTLHHDPAPVGHDGIPHKPYKYFIHVGVGLPGAVKCEQLAHRDGYSTPDNESQVIPDGFIPEYHDEPPELISRVDVSALVQHLLLEKGWANVSPSRDAGRYLCDFIYYCSLAECKRMEGDKVVLFVHVPAIGVPYQLEDLTDIIQNIVSWVASRY